MGPKKDVLIPILLYRSLLRFSNTHHDVPLTLRSMDIANCLRNMPYSTAYHPQDRASVAVASLARFAFRANLHLTGKQKEIAIDKGFEALHLLNTSYAASAIHMRATRIDRANRKGVGYKIGTVFVHKRYGYR